LVGRADVKGGCLNVLRYKKVRGGQIGSKRGQEAGVYGGRQQGQGGRGKLGLTLFIGSPEDFNNAYGIKGGV
jgi:hypothetical protein